MKLIEENVSLKGYNTFGMEVKAKYFAPFKTVDRLKELLDSAPASEATPLILGGGSNMLLTEDVNRMVLKNELCGIEKVGEDDDHIFIKAGAGENWHRFVLYCLMHNYAGVENMALIPGSVGASPMQNIGAYGVEIKDVFHQLETLHIKDKTVRTFTKEECKFGYRESVFKHQYKGQYIITSVTFKLFKKPILNTSYGAIQQELLSMGVQKPTIQLIAQAVMNIRTSKLPDWTTVGNAGSFFKNPEIPKEQYEDLKKLHSNIVAFPLPGGNVKLAAGWLIEQCGWKGHRQGDAGCYPKQALVLVNYGTATGKEIYSLSQQVIDSVQQKFHVALEREVNII